MEIKVVGISRFVDDIGRIVIPVDIRKKCNIHANDEVEVFATESGDVVIRKIQNKGV